MPSGRSKQVLILGIGGTTRAASTSERALRLALGAAASCGAATEMLLGADLQLPTYEPDVEDRSPAARRFVELARRADGIIVASPGYHGSISGLLKNAIDYVEDLRACESPYFEGRAVGCIACAAGWQAAGTTLTALRSIVHALRGWPTPLGVALNSAQPLFEGSGRCLDPAAQGQLELVGRQVAEFAQMRRAYRSEAA